MRAIAEACYLAQNLARNRGYAVFPCRDNKEPATPHGFKDAVTEPNAVTVLWRQHPGHLIGIACGERSGVSVLDVDVKHDTARAWWRANEIRLPITRTYRTRGGGLHLFFQHAAGVRNAVGRPVPGIDSRGEGGYIVFWFAAGCECLDPAPPAPWPHWLSDFFWPPAAAPNRATAVSPGPASSKFLEAVRDRAIQRVRTAADGKRWLQPT